MRMSGIKIRLTLHSNWLADAGYTIEEEDKIYDELLEDIIRNPRWYLEQYMYLPEFRVRWGNYRTNISTIPRKNRKIYK